MTDVPVWQVREQHKRLFQRVCGMLRGAWEEAETRLYPDRSAFAEEESRRFSLVEEHWDVIVMPAE